LKAEGDRLLIILENNNSVANPI